MEETIPSIESALESPEDFQLCYTPQFGWALSRVGSEVSVLITAEEAQRFVCAGDLL